MEGAGIGDAACRRDFGDRIADDGDLGGDERFEVVNSRGRAPAAYACRWDDDGFNGWILELVFHFLSKAGAQFGLRRAVRNIVPVENLW